MPCPFHLSYRPHALPIPSLIQTTHTISYRLHALPIPSHTDHTPCPFHLSYKPPTPSHSDFMPCPFHLSYRLPIPSLLQTSCTAHSICHRNNIPCPFHPIQFISYRKMPCPLHSALFYIHYSNYFLRIIKLVSMRLSESSFFFFICGPNVLFIALLSTFPKTFSAFSLLLSII